MAFGDVTLSKSRVTTGPDGGAQNPGAGGWPTVRYYSKATGYDGAPYAKKTSMSMCDELGALSQTATRSTSLCVLAGAGAPN